jgi:hypothetical protein
MFDKGGLMETVAPVVPDIDIKPDLIPFPDTDPDWDLQPDKLCPDQKSRVVRRITRAIP